VADSEKAGGDLQQTMARLVANAADRNCSAETYAAALKVD
jgi:hypothetical protein